MALKSAINSTVSMVGRLYTFLSFCASTMWDAFDRRDLFFFVGLAMLWYGLKSNYSIGIAFIVVGGVLTTVGIVGSLLGGDK